MVQYKTVELFFFFSASLFVSERAGVLSVRHCEKNGIYEHGEWEVWKHKRMPKDVG